MIGALEVPWTPGETDRYEPCPRHRNALSRMSYDDAWDHAAKLCANCVAEVRQ